ncbi:MAG: cytochrome P450 [Myxococcota bacterium]|jgi:sterol 14-demethylase
MTGETTLRGWKAIPKLDGGGLLLGHFSEYNGGMWQFLQRAYAEGGPIVRFRLAQNDMVLISGPEASEAFFRAPEDQLSNREAYKKSQTPVFGPGIIFDVPLETHMEQLQMMVGALKPQALRRYGDQIAAETRRAVADWGEEGEVDFLDFMGQLALYASARTLLGQSFRDDTTDEFAALYHDLEAGVNPLSYFFPNLPLPVFRRRDRARERLVELIGRMATRRRTSGEPGDDMLQGLIEARYQDGRALDDEEIVGLLLFLLFAGHHSTSVATTWTMIELLRHPGYLARVEAERVHLQNDHATEGYADLLRGAEQLNRGIQESLRLHPPLIMMMRKVMRPFRYGGYEIPVGKFVVQSPAVGHFLKEVWEDPERFDPDRFGPDRREDDNPFAFTAFGGGKHKCIGMNFAYIQMKVILSTLFSQFEFEIGEDEYEPARDSLIIAPVQPCRIRYRRRRAA